jgi:hypothetical protein
MLAAKQTTVCVTLKAICALSSEGCYCPRKYASASHLIKGVSGTQNCRARPASAIERQTFSQDLPTDFVKPPSMQALLTVPAYSALGVPSCRCHHGQQQQQTETLWQSNFSWQGCGKGETAIERLVQAHNVTCLCMTPARGHNARSTVQGGMFGP